MSFCLFLAHVFYELVFLCLCSLAVSVSNATCQFISVCLGPSVYLYVCLSVYVCMSVYVCLCMYVCVCMSRMSVYLCLSLSLPFRYVLLYVIQKGITVCSHLCMSLSLCPSLCLSLSVCLSICLSLFLCLPDPVLV